jgi:hypothetical protein
MTAFAWQTPVSMTTTVPVNEALDTVTLSGSFTKTNFNLDSIGV